MFWIGGQSRQDDFIVYQYLNDLWFLELQLYYDIIFWTSSILPLTDPILGSCGIGTCISHINDTIHSHNTYEFGFSCVEWLSTSPSPLKVTVDFIVKLTISQWNWWVESLIVIRCCAHKHQTRNTSTWTPIPIPWFLSTAVCYIGSKVTIVAYTLTHFTKECTSLILNKNVDLPSTNQWATTTKPSNSSIIWIS